MTPDPKVARQRATHRAVLTAIPWWCIERLAKRPRDPVSFARARSWREDPLQEEVAMRDRADVLLELLADDVEGFKGGHVATYDTRKPPFRRLVELLVRADDLAGDYEDPRVAEFRRASAQ